MSKKTFLQGKYTVTVESKESDAGSWSSAIGLPKGGADVPVHSPTSSQSAWSTDAEAILAGIAQGLVCANRENDSVSD